MCLTHRRREAVYRGAISRVRVRVQVEAVFDKSIGGRPEPVGVEVEEFGGLRARPPIRQQVGRKARVAEQECPPGVHELEAGGEGGLQVAVFIDAVDDRVQLD